MPKYGINIRMLVANGGGGVLIQRGGPMHIPIEKGGGGDSRTTYTACTPLACSTYIYRIQIL